jgi:hypothetical protein
MSGSFPFATIKLNDIPYALDIRISRKHNVPETVPILNIMGSEASRRGNVLW